MTMSKKSSALLAVLAMLYKGPDRLRFREEWSANVAFADSLGISPTQVLLSAVATVAKSWMPETRTEKLIAFVFLITALFVSPFWLFAMIPLFFLKLE